MMQLSKSAVLCCCPFVRLTVNRQLSMSNFCVCEVGSHFLVWNPTARKGKEVTTLTSLSRVLLSLFPGPCREEQKPTSYPCVEIAIVFWCM
jgi:hypothetical protein